MSSDYTAPEWPRAALVVVDVQLDFLDGGTCPIPGTTEALPRIADTVAAFRSTGRPIVHVVRLYVPGGSDVDLPRRAAVEGGAIMAAPGTTGAQIPQELLAHPVELDADLLLAGLPQVLDDNEVIVFKPRWSAFHRTPLESWLRERDVTTVVVAGCNLPNCPRASLFDASERDFRTVLVTDAVSGATPERLEDLRGIGVNLLESRQVDAALRP